MREKVKKYFKKVRDKITSHPTYVAFSRQADKLAKPILTGLLAFFSCIGPLLTFLCTKTPDTDKSDNKVSRSVIQTYS